MDVSLTVWMSFGALVLCLLALDLGVFQRKAHTPSFKESLIWSAVWSAMAAGFGLWVWSRYGHDAGMAFFTGWAMEKSLSVDNLFLFLVIFQSLAIPAALQHRVLFWGVFGALILRALFLIVGIALIQKFSWMLFVFGLLLIWTGWKLCKPQVQKFQAENSKILRALKFFFPISDQNHGSSFWIREDGRWKATPLFAALVVVEATDVLFAVDSVPAVLAISQDPFIVYTSNVFAILGLRSLYFALSGLAHLFHFLSWALAAILMFVGGKMILSPWVHVSPLVSLAVILSALTLAVWASLKWPKKEASSA